MPNASIDEIRQALTGAQKILVTSHLRPDGDAVGSLLGFGTSLELAGKLIQFVLVDGVPATYRFLAGSDKIKHKAEGCYDLAVVVDCSDFQRAAGVFTESQLPDINIDHHITNLEFARLNWVDHNAVATSEILYGLLRCLNLPISPAVAGALMTGILADTIGFRTSNMTPGVMRITAELMEAGAVLPELYKSTLLTRSFNAVRFWGYGLSKLERQDGLVWAVLSTGDRLSAGYSGKDDADLINLLTLINDAEIAVVFVEQPEGKVKVSWRAVGHHDVSSIAIQYQGGGHQAAAGAMIDGSLNEVIRNVIEETQKLS